MPQKLNLLDNNLGIQGFLEEQRPKYMPLARQMPSSILSEPGLDELYNISAADRAIEAVLCPSVGDGTLVQPEVFRHLLSDSLSALSKHEDSAVREFAQNELRPIMENGELFAAYAGLMLGG